MDANDLIELADAIQTSALNIGLFVSIVLVFLMQPGFMLLEVGSISRLNVVNDLYKNALDFAVGALAFWLVGYDILTGDSLFWEWIADLGLKQEPVLASGVWRPAPEMDFLFQLAFATTAATICSGAVTARILPHGYLLFAMIFTGFIYPVVAFLVWNEASILYGVFRDFAGAVVVHSVGAAAGLAGTLLLGPRIGFNGYDPIGLGQERLFRLAKRHAPHNMPIAALGVLLLLLGWFGFNGGTALVGPMPAISASADMSAAAEQIMSQLGSVLIATVLAAAACAATLVVMNIVLREDLHLLDTMNGFIAGAVSVTAGADLLAPGEAVLVGALAALVFRATRKAFIRLSVDDPVSAVAAHGFTGVLGVAAVGAVASDASVELVLWQLLIGLAFFLGVFLASIGAFTLSKWIYGLGIIVSGRQSPREKARRHALRIDYQTEIEGMDVELHGQGAYGPTSQSRLD